MTKYIKQCTLKKKIIGLVGPEEVVFPPCMVCLDLVGLWVVLIVAPFVDLWSLILLGLSALTVCVPLPYGFFFGYTLLYGFIYKTFDQLTLWLYNLWTFYLLYCFWSLDLSWIFFILS